MVVLVVVGVDVVVVEVAVVVVEVAFVDGAGGGMVREVVVAGMVLLAVVVLWR